MKTNKIIIASLMAVGMLFAACTEEAPLREPSPAENGTVFFSATNATAVELEPNSTFSVVVCREATAESATFKLTYTESVDSAFTLDPTVTFAAGDSIAIVNVTLNPVLKAGTAATLSLTIPETMATYYATHSFPTLDVNVTADYIWVSAGKVVFMSQWEGAQAEVAIEQASDYTDTKGYKLYRLNSPYYHVAPTYCTVPGLHIQFFLDAEYNAVTLNHPEGYLAFEDTGYYLYWDLTGQYKAYCQFISQGDLYAIIAPWSDGAGLYGPYQEMWQWVEGYPGAAAE